MMRYNVQLNEQQFADIVTGLMMAEATAIEAIETWDGNRKQKEAAAESQMRYIKLRAYLQHIKEETICQTLS